MRYSIGIDLGGTRIKGVALDAHKNVLQQLYVPTNDSGDSAVWKNAVAEAVRQLQAYCPGDDVVIGISAPGITNDANTAIAYMPGRLDGLENFVWGDFVGKKTRVLNDAISALVAEAALGAARGRQNAVLLTLGTGVGGAILIDGKPYQGAFHKAGHFGHMSIDNLGGPDITGIPGSLEDAIGNHNIGQRSLGRFQSTRELLEYYEKGDYFAQWLWLHSVRQLAVGIASITNVVSPECIVIAGGITEAGKNLFEPLEHFLALYEWRSGGNHAEIVKAHFGDLAGAIGAACYALETT